MKYILIFILLISSIKKFGQKHDHIWIAPLAGNLNEAKIINFNETPPVIKPTFSITDMSITNTSFCNKEGNLLFFSNGIWIRDHYGNLLENGDSINAGNMADQHIEYGYRVFNGAFFLPFPNDSTSCLLFHMFLEELPVVGYTLQKLLYTKIDRTANNGLGKVIEKNIPLLVGDETLGFHHASTVRHANGRDWWIIVPNQLEPIYYRFLLTPNGIEGPEIQEIGFLPNQPILYPYDHVGINLFSQDGSKYIDYDIFKGEGFQVFDFDRCTGLLDNPIKVDYETGFEISNGTVGIALSPSGRFAYMTYNRDYKYRLVQYDLEAMDIEASEVLLSECPGPTTSPYECSFVRPLLAPDGKIYVSAMIDTTSYHIIHYPDSLGLACELDFGGFKIGKSSHISPPYFPNYRLYDVPGSTCDTLGIDAPGGTVAVGEQGEKAALDIYPNPSGGEVNIRYGLSGKDGQVDIFNLQGQKVRSASLPLNKEEVQVRGLSPGIYFVRVLANGYVLNAGKVVVH